VCISDWPKDVSTLAPYKDGYTDILEERRHTSDFTFMTRSREDVPQYKYRVLRSPEEIRQHVLTSDRVKYTVERVSFHFSHHGVAKCVVLCMVIVYGLVHCIG